jgi:ABC-type antimicrobial peptide transport system permease subunit
VRYRPGTDAIAAGQQITAALTASGCPIATCVAYGDQRPGEIKDYAGIRDTPLALAAVLVVLAVGTLAHTLLSSVRRRRRDLAMFKTLGCTRRQVLGVVAWQATALAAAALMAGIPVGVIAGRVAWAVFANAAGVAPQPDVPLTLILLGVPLTLLLANVIAAWPGWAAAQIRPAAVLHAE